MSIYKHVDSTLMFRGVWICTFWLGRWWGVGSVIVWFLVLGECLNVLSPCRDIDHHSGLPCCSANTPHSHVGARITTVAIFVGAFWHPCVGLSIATLLECLSVNYYAFKKNRYYFDRALGINRLTSTI